MHDRKNPVLVAKVPSFAAQSMVAKRLSPSSVSQCEKSTGVWSMKAKAIEVVYIPLLDQPGATFAPRHRWVVHCSEVEPELEAAPQLFK